MAERETQWLLSYPAAQQRNPTHGQPPPPKKKRVFPVICLESLTASTYGIALLQIIICSVPLGSGYTKMAPSFADAQEQLQ